MLSSSPTAMIHRRSTGGGAAARRRMRRIADNNNNNKDDDDDNNKNGDININGSKESSGISSSSLPIQQPQEQQQQSQPLPLLPRKQAEIVLTPPLVSKKKIAPQSKSPTNVNFNDVHDMHLTHNNHSNNINDNISSSNHSIHSNQSNQSSNSNNGKKMNLRLISRQRRQQRHSNNDGIIESSPISTTTPKDNNVVRIEQPKPLSPSPTKNSSSSPSSLSYPKLSSITTPLTPSSSSIGGNERRMTRTRLFTPDNNTTSSSTIDAAVSPTNSAHIISKAHLRRLSNNEEEPELEPEPSYDESDDDDESDDELDEFNQVDGFENDKDVVKEVEHSPPLQQLQQPPLPQHQRLQQQSEPNNPIDDVYNDKNSKIMEENENRMNGSRIHTNSIEHNHNDDGFNNNNNGNRNPKNWEDYEDAKDKMMTSSIRTNPSPTTNERKERTIVKDNMNHESINNGIPINLNNNPINSTTNGNNTINNNPTTNNISSSSSVLQLPRPP